MKLTLNTLLEDEELFGTKVGRYSDAEEHMMKRLMSSHNPVAGWLRSGRDLSKPGYYSSRPVSADGGESFSFSHRNVVLRATKQPHADRLYCSGPASGRADLKFDRSVASGGSRGCWYAPTGRLPDGFVPIQPVAMSIGMRSGVAATHQAYIERFGAVEMHGGQMLSIGSIHDNQAIREAFWGDVEEREGPGKRVQSRLIADLPYEKEVGPEGRFQILKELGSLFDEWGLPWHGVVHHPEAHSDPRNYHIHLLYHSRPVQYWTDADQPVFAESKAGAIRHRDWLKSLRKAYAEIVNKAFEKAGLKRVWDPRTYKDMGIAKLPGRHLGSAAMNLERKGITTTFGTEAARREMATEFLHIRARRESKARELWSRLVGAIETLEPKPNEGDRLLMAKQRLARSIAHFSEVWWARETTRERRAMVSARQVHWMSRLNASMSQTSVRDDAIKIKTRLDRLLRRFNHRLRRQERRADLRIVVADRQCVEARKDLAYERLRADYFRARSSYQLEVLGRDRDRRLTDKGKQTLIQKVEGDIRIWKKRVTEERNRLLQSLSAANIPDPEKVVAKFERYGARELPAEHQTLLLPYETCIANLRSKEGDMRRAQRQQVISKDEQGRIEGSLGRKKRELEITSRALEVHWKRFKAETGIDVRVTQKGKQLSGRH